MEFRILGPLEVVDDEGRDVRLGGGRQRALLAALILRCNQVVSGDELLEEIWGDEVPASGVRLVQVYVSQLRKLLGPEVIVTRAHGYALVADREAVDLQRFEDLVAAAEHAEPERALAMLQRALALWRGQPLADFAYDSFAQVEIARLRELKLSAVEARMNAELELGLHPGAVAELEALVAEYPLREQLRALLMRALYRSGRQQEALSVFRATRTALREELGLEPGRALRDLHEAILNQDASLDVSVPSAATELEGAVTASAAGEASGGRAARKTITAVSVRLAVSSTRAVRLDPEALRRVTDRAAAAFENAVTLHGGIVDAIGGAVLTAFFGLRTLHEDDALRAVRAAAELRDSLAMLAAELRRDGGIDLDWALGVSTGEVVTGGTGTQFRATGEPLTCSARLAQAAQTGEVLLDQPTRRVVQVAVVAEPAVEGWRLVEVAAVVDAPPRRLVSPMVGRERERRRLHDAFAQAVSDSSCQLFTVLGLAGVGKSRLVQEFLVDVAGQARVVRGRCLPYGQGITYWPLLEVVKDAVGLDDADAPEAARLKLLGAIGDRPGSDRIAQGVAELIGLTDAAATAEQGFLATRELFEELAQAEPLVCVFDDIHWAEAKFLDLVEHIADWARDAPVLLVCLARPELLELRPAWAGGKLNATTTLLEPLSDEQSALLITNLVGEGPLADEVGASIVAAAEGNPFFVEEMLLMLVDDGVLVRENGRWSAVGDVGAVRVPPTIQALLAARLDQLDPSERAVIERAAVAGKIFQQGAISELATDALRPAISDALAGLVRKELIRPERASLGEPTYRFRHLLIRDAAYESLPKQARADMHERFGRWLERTVGERAIEYEEVIGYHLEQAYRYRDELGAVGGTDRALAREAAERLGRAARRAFVRSDAPAGINLISRAAALLPPDDPKRVELVPNVRVIQGMNGDLGWAEKVLTEAIEAAATTGDRRLAATALVQRAFFRLFTEADVTAEELIDAARRAIGVFEVLGDDLGLARAWRLTAQAHYLGRRAAACADASERALEHARRAGDVFEQREILEWLAIALFLGPTPAAEAAHRCELLLEQTEGDLVLDVHILGALAFLVAMQGQLEQARELTTRGRRLMEQLGDWIWVYSWHFAAINLWQGDPVAAEQELLPAYEALKKLGEKSHFSTMAHGLASAAYMQGRYDDANQFTHECEDAARPNDVYSGIIWRSIRAKVLARKGELAAAEQLALHAVALARDSDFLIAHADALLDLAEVHILAGKPAAAAAAAIDEAIHYYEQKGNLLAVHKAQAMLEERAQP